MEQAILHQTPMRISDFAAFKERGSNVTCQPAFEIHPVDFVHRDKRFQAVIFSCRFSGTVDGREYTFRKCYARGCRHNLCPHVSQAVMTANRYLQRDYRTLKEAGVRVEEKLFTLEDMLVKFREEEEEGGTGMLTVDDYVKVAREGTPMKMDIQLEDVPAVEHLEYKKNHQVFLMGDFIIDSQGKTHTCQRCFACYPADREADERPRQVRVANARLERLYQDFDQAPSVRYEKRFFSEAI